MLTSAAVWFYALLVALLGLGLGLGGALLPFGLAAGRRRLVLFLPLGFFLGGTTAIGVAFVSISLPFSRLTLKSQK